MAIETHADEREAKVFAAKSLVISAFKEEIEEYQRLDAKRDDLGFRLAELRRHQQLLKLMAWIHSTPPEL